MIFDFAERGKTERIQTRQLADLDFVHVVIPAQQQ